MHFRKNMNIFLRNVQGIVNVSSVFTGIPSVVANEQGKMGMPMAGQDRYHSEQTVRPITGTYPAF